MVFAKETLSLAPGDVPRTGGDLPRIFETGSRLPPPPGAAGLGIPLGEGVLLAGIEFIGLEFAGFVDRIGLGLGGLICAGITATLLNESFDVFNAVRAIEAAVGLG